VVAAGTTDVALFFHLLGALLLFAGLAVAGAGFEAARRRRAVGEIALLLSLTRVGVALVGVGSLLALVFGLWLVHLEHVGYGAGWVDGALGLFVAMAVLGAVGGRRPRHARELAQGGGSEADVRRLLDDPVTLALNYASLAIVVAIVVLMVFKPGGS
jgi:uncharacterized membrane protein